MRFEPEWRYKADGNPRDTPDILLPDSASAIRLAIECKARWMKADVRFAENPSIADDYDEIVRGVFQIWRFFSDCRRGRAGRAVADNAIGVVLALDEWFAARGSVLESVLDEANARADASGPHILAEDRRPVAFCTISELESVLETATEQSLLEAFGLLATSRRGWIFSSLHSDLDAPKSERKPYPFDDALLTLLPWYAGIKDAAAAEGDDDEFE
jgi:hypothetical protein